MIPALFKGKRGSMNERRRYRVQKDSRFFKESLPIKEGTAPYFGVATRLRW